MTIKLSYTQNFRWSITGEPFLAYQAFTPVYLNLTTWADSNRCSLGFEKDIKTPQPHDKREKATRYFTVFGLGSIITNTRIALHQNSLDLIGEVSLDETRTLFFGYNKNMRTLFVADWEAFKSMNHLGYYRRSVWGTMREVMVLCHPLSIALSMMEVRE